MRPDIAGWSSLVARRAHNPEVVGSNPAPATKFSQALRGLFLYPSIGDGSFWTGASAGDVHFDTPVDLRWGVSKCTSPRHTHDEEHVRDGSMRTRDNHETVNTSLSRRGFLLGGAALGATALAGCSWTPRNAKTQETEDSSQPAEENGAINSTPRSTTSSS